MGKRTKIFLLILLAIVFLLSLSIVIYPLISSSFAQQSQSEVIVDYLQAVEDGPDEEVQAALLAARDYNLRLAQGAFSPLDFKNNGYYDLLDPTGKGVMGSLEIPKITLKLPIYHGTGSDALSKGAGHMEQSSLPVGGASTHAVISAHTGMASKVMFTDLVLVEVGDVFYITVLGEKLAYQVDQIKTVLPTQLDDVKIVEGQDFVTLTTCAPYGSNTHRLLVRGTRIPLETEEESDATAAPDASVEPTTSVWKGKYVAAILAGLCGAVSLMLIILVIVLIRHRYKKK